MFRPALLILSFLAASVSSTSISRDTSWNDVHAYIEEHATAYDSTTEGSLWAESVQGQKTWEVASPSRLAKVDGWGLGWPKSGEEIEFASASDAEECGAMIDEFREAQSR